jgi:hypothetical protein
VAAVAEPNSRAGIDASRRVASDDHAGIIARGDRADEEVDDRDLIDASRQFSNSPIQIGGEQMDMFAAYTVILGKFGTFWREKRERSGWDSKSPGVKQ